MDSQVMPDSARAAALKELDALLGPQSAAPAQAPSPATADPLDDIISGAEAELSRRVPTWTQRLDQATGTAWDWAKNAVTGDDRREFDLPELPDFTIPSREAGPAPLIDIGIPKAITGEGAPSAGVSAGARMSLGRDDARKIDILRNTAGINFPAFADKFGNVMVDIPDDFAKQAGIKAGRYYVNRPGLSPQDLNDVLTTGAISAFTIANPLTRMGGALGTAGVAAGSAGGSALQDVAATTAGARRDMDTYGVNPQAALIAGVVGGVTEAGARLLVPQIRKIFTRGYSSAKGFTPAAQEALRKAGIDPDSLTPEWVRKFQDAAKQHVDLDGAARYADADSLPAKVPLSKGDITRDTLDQSFESSALKGARGKGAMDVMEVFRDQQQTALRSNVDDIGARLGTGAAMEPGTGLPRVQQKLAADASSTHRAAQSAYDAATTSGARIDAGGLRQFSTAARQNLRGGFGQADNATAYALLDELDAALTGPGGKVTKVVINRVEEFRQALSKAERAAGRDPSGVALRQVRGKLDDFLDEAVERGMVSGDMEALGKFKEARGLWKTLRTKYDGDGIASMLIEFDPATGSYVPKGTAEDAARTLFSASGVGYKKGAQKGAEALRDVLGPDSQEWRALKQEAFMRLLRSNDKGGVRDKAGELVFSGDKFSTAWRDAMRDSPELMRTLFSPEELGLIRQFERVALLATNRKSGAVNFSNSAEKLGQVAFSKITEAFPGSQYILAPLWKKIGRFASEAVDEAAARAATQGTARAAARDLSLPTPWRGSPGAAAAVGTGTAPRQKDLPQ